MLALPEEITDSILQFSSPVGTNVLLASKALCRIGLPHVYHTVTLPTGKEIPLKHASLIRKVVLRGARGKDVTQILEAAGKELKELDVELVDEEIDDEFVRALEGLTSLTRLTIRKSAAAVYLSMPNVRSFIHLLAGNVEKHWRSLEVVSVDFKMSEPATTPGPLTHLARAVASLPKLHSFRTPVPTLFSDIFLIVAQCASLTRICLAKDGQGIMPTGLFMNGVVNHPRLLELVRNGTAIVRLRAQTLQIAPPTILPSPTTNTKTPQPPSPHAHNSRVLQRRLSIPPTLHY
ncbi:hypothetical protein PM082_008502 [Marasmius tenuissimus]|nr:hypothetical protein PM082_008502 [Marasmius tenuissimus]